MKPTSVLLTLALTALSPLHADESAAIAALTAKGVEINKSADGKITRLMVKDGGKLTAEHFKAVAGIKTLKTLLIDARKQAVQEDAVDAFRQARSEVAVAMSKPGDQTPPALPKKARQDPPSP